MTEKAKPNEHGHYTEDCCLIFEHTDKRSSMRIRVVQEESGAFLTGYDFEYGCGNYSGSCGGPSSGQHAPRFKTLDEALEHERKHALRHFDISKLTDCSATEEQRRIALEFTRLLIGGWPFDRSISQQESPPATSEAIPQMSLF